MTRAPYSDRLGPSTGKGLRGAHCPGTAAQTAALIPGRGALCPREMDRVLPLVEQIPDASFFWARKGSGGWTISPGPNNGFWGSPMGSGV